MAMHAKDPSATVDYSFDWAAWLTGGETITNADWRVDPAGDDAPTLSNPVNGGHTRGILVSGGVRGARYRLTCTIETDAGRTGERSLSLYVMER
ncbi:phage fiber-tail adaptor protein [Kordiimonas aestuarii]|uniref:phage fiber-tail adaptor protein n=1 Tax=Kordiimonas aestuarii TaxID=1005925 RepID=UPI0021D35FF6|nr:hypothetical protein [Kordiimonas aestuarii]